MREPLLKETSITTPMFTELYSVNWLRLQQWHLYSPHRQRVYKDYHNSTSSVNKMLSMCGLDENRKASKAPMQWTAPPPFWRSCVVVARSKSKSRLVAVATCYCRALQSITEYNRVLQSITEYYRALQSYTEYYKVLQRQIKRIYLDHFSCLFKFVE